MITDELRAVLQNIIHGTGNQRQGGNIAEIRSQLIQSFGPGRTSKKGFENKRLIKEEQAELLRKYSSENNCWSNTLPSPQSFIAQGGESRVYLSEDGLDVLKLNNARYYATWTEYFNSLLLHNLFFPSASYKLLGFVFDQDNPDDEDGLSVVLQQPFIEGDQANLNDIREFLNFNEFQLIKAQDYFNSEFRITLEDMHDENVILREGVLFFIDTVFYIME